MKLARSSFVLVGAALITLGLAACAPAGSGKAVESLGLGSGSSATPHASATPTPFVIGSTLTKSDALKLRVNIPSDGDYAYHLKDGTWVAINIHQPLPPTVQSELNAQAAGIPTNNTAANTAGSDAATSLRGLAAYATGKSVVVVARMETVYQNSNAMAWVADTDASWGSQVSVSPTEADEVAKVQAAIVASGDSLNDWVIITQ
jgi:hypothetical protein